MRKVLFVCLGNICRSPLAEAIFDHLVKLENMEDLLTSDSCGTGAYHVGEKADHRSIAVAEKHNIPINNRARQFQKEDFEEFDYIIAMDRQNLRDIQDLNNKNRDNILLMRDFDDLSAENEDVPDPYYGGPEGFQNVYNMLLRSNQKFIEHLKAEIK